MGNSHAFEKTYIQQQKQLKPAKTTVVGDEIDNPDFTVLQELPQYVRFLCPTAMQNAAVRQQLRDIMVKPQEQKIINLSRAAGWAADESSCLLPLILYRCTALEDVNLTGQSVDLSILAAMIPRASSLRAVTLRDAEAPYHVVRQFVNGLTNVPRRQIPLTIHMNVGNPFWDSTSPESVASNDALEMSLKQIVSQNNVHVIFPDKPEAPFFVNNVPVLFTKMNTNHPIQNPLTGTSTYITEYNVNLEDREDAKEKIDFIHRTIRYIADAQRRPNHDLGLQYIPQFYHCCVRSPVSLTIVHEDILRSNNYTAISELWGPRSIDNFSLHWRLTIALQVSYVAKFLHSLPEPAGLREIFPMSILVDRSQQRIMYTNIKSLRSPGANSIFHFDGNPNEVRCADPSENNLVDFTLPGDMYCLAMMLVFFIVPMPPNAEIKSATFDKKNFRNFFQPPPNQLGVVSEQQGHFKGILQSNGLNDEIVEQLSLLVAECTMKDPSKRPAVQVFISRLEDVLRSL